MLFTKDICLGSNLNVICYLQKTYAVYKRHMLFAKYMSVIYKRHMSWKQPKCPSAEEWIKNMWYIHTVEYYSAIKKNEIMPFAATWMYLDIIIPSEVSQTEKGKYMISLICGILKKAKNELIYKTEIELQM